MKDRDERVRWWVVWALGEMGGLAEEPLTHALKDEDWNVRRAAKEALENIRVKSA
jgi:HEAT repeat protein